MNKFKLGETVVAKLQYSLECPGLIIGITNSYYLVKFSNDTIAKATKNRDFHTGKHLEIIQGRYSKLCDSLYLTESDLTKTSLTDPSLTTILNAEKKDEFEIGDLVSYNNNIGTIIGQYETGSYLVKFDLRNVSKDLKPYLHQGKVKTLIKGTSSNEKDSYCIAPRHLTKCLDTPEKSVSTSKYKYPEDYKYIIGEWYHTTSLGPILIIGIIDTQIKTYFIHINSAYVPPYATTGIEYTYIAGGPCGTDNGICATEETLQKIIQLTFKLNPIWESYRTKKGSIEDWRNNFPILSTSEAVSPYFVNATRLAEKDLISIFKDVSYNKEQIKTDSSIIIQEDVDLTDITTIKVSQTIKIN